MAQPPEAAAAERQRQAAGGAITASDDTDISAAVTHMPASGATSAAGRNRTAAWAATPAGSHSNASDQNPCRETHPRSSMP